MSQEPWYMARRSRFALMTRMQDPYGDYMQFQNKKYDKDHHKAYCREFQKYLEWHARTHGFYKGFQRDVDVGNILHLMAMFAWPIFGAGIAIGIMNPNFTLPSSYYFRRINILMSVTAFTLIGVKLERAHNSFIYMKIADYLPHDVKRALSCKDYRYFMKLDYDKINFPEGSAKPVQ